MRDRNVLRREPAAVPTNRSTCMNRNAESHRGPAGENRQHFATSTECGYYDRYRRPADGIVSGSPSGRVALQLVMKTPQLRCISPPYREPRKRSMGRSMRNNMGRQAARLILAIGLLMTLAGCVVYPAGAGYWRPHPCCYYWR